MPQVQVIQPIQQQPKRLRVAAYARVSSDSTDQLNSLSVQVDYYTHLIQENPNWDFAGIYADEGITGTSTKHREQFNRLLDDCRAGLIDRVLVKSASRFARNTADALASVREMKSLGVTVVFEKEGFDTETANGEMILSMICATAQEESLSISQNTKWGIRKKMHDGTYITSLTPFGYKKINRQLFPDEKEAATVKEIFNLFLNGFSTAEIANHLNTNHPKPDVIWRSASVRFILRNEKYIGDSLFQKNYTPDTLPLKSCCNTGQLPKYYVEGTHPGIISKDEFERVQSLLTQKNINSTNSRACILSKVVFCALCGHVCSRKVRKSQTFVWCCRTHLQSAALCPLKPVSETEIQQAFLSVYNKLQANQSYILQPIIDTLLQLRFLQEQANSARQTARDDVQRLAKQRHNLTRIHTLGYIDNAQFLERSIALDQQLREKKKFLSKRTTDNYALSERLVCGDCGSSYKRVTWSIHGRKQIVWRCVNRLEYGTKFCSNSPSIPETELHQAILKAVQNLAAKFTGEVADQLNGILHQIEVGESLTPQLQAQLEQNQQEFDHLLEMSLDFDENTPFLDDKLKRLSDKIKQLKTAITQSSVNSQTPSTPTNPITAKDLLITEYDDMLTARIIEKIIVKSRQDLEIIFIGGYTQQISLQ